MRKQRQIANPEKNKYLLVETPKLFLLTINKSLAEVR
jgi:hypothetical protein